MIPYGRHSVTLSDALKVAWQIRFHSLTQGSKIEEFENAVAKYVGSKYAVAVSSATAGLHLAMLALDLPANSKVVTSPISFVASSNSILYAGHKPVFVDIERDSLNLNPHLVQEAVELDSGIKAIIPVHFAGLTCDMEKLLAIAQRSNLGVIEDAAHALGASYKDGEKVGSCKHSDMTVLSFHPVKSITTGEGGMITTNSPRLYKKLLRLRSHGINKLDDQFKDELLSKTSGETNPWYYEMIELGFNYRLTEIQAVLGLNQLSRLDKFIVKRRKFAQKYHTEFAKNINFYPAQLINIKDSAHHIFPIRIKFSAIKVSRNEFMKTLNSRGIGSQVHYIPIPLQPYYQNLGYDISSLPEALAYYQEALTIPLYPNLKNSDQNLVIKTLNTLLN